MKKFYFGQFWQVYGTNSIEVPDDFTLEQAQKYVTEHWDDIGLAPSANYVQDSDEPDFETCRFEEKVNIQIIKSLNGDYSKFQKEIENAVGRYGSDHIDIVYSENDGIYGMYHSGNNSFSVTGSYDISTASKEETEEYCNSLGIGYCEIN